MDMESYVGWDLSQSAYMTNYLTSAAGIVLAMLVLKNFGLPVWGGCGPLPHALAAYLLLTGISSGLAAMAIHMLAVQKEEGVEMEKRFFHGEDSYWLWPWTLSVLFGPLASAAALNFAITYVRRAGWGLQVVKVLGLLVSLVEVGLCGFDVDATTTASFYWGLFCAAVGGVVVLVGGGGRSQADGARDDGLFLVCVGAFAIQVLSCAIILLLPAVCTKKGEAVHTTAGTLYVKDQGTKEFFLCQADEVMMAHMCTFASVIVMFLGGILKADRERANDYLNIMRDTYHKQPRCCGPC